MHFWVWKVLQFLLIPRKVYLCNILRVFLALGMALSQEEAKEVVAEARKKGIYIGQELVNALNALS